MTEQWTPPPVPIRVWPERIWPVTKDGAPPFAFALALAAGLVAAITLRLDVPGIGVLLTGSAMLAAALAAPRRRVPLPRLVPAVLAVALLAVGAVRAADWLFALCAVAAVVLGTLAFTGGRTWIGLFLGVGAMALGAPRNLGWTARGLRALGAGRGLRLGRALLVTALTVALLLLFGALFYGADGAFARIVDTVLPQFLGPSAIGNIVLAAIVMVATLGGAYLAAYPPGFDELARRQSALRTWEWAVPLGVLNLLFGVFAAIQLLILFGHRRPALAGDYAEYARQGFWQLLAVTVLTLAVVAVAAAKSGRETVRDRVIVRVLLGALCCSTLVIVASAISRMRRYENEYGYTQLRVVVHGVEFWLGAVFVLILVAGIRLSGSWLPPVIAVSAALALLGLAALNPDAYIARRNVERYAATGKIDVRYLGQLGPDAIPELQKITDEKRRSCALRFAASRMDEFGPGEERWYIYNAGRSQARRALAAKPPTTPAIQCP
jgi:hypothetical protein